MCYEWYSNSNYFFCGFLTKMDCDCFAVQSDSLNLIEVNFVQTSSCVICSRHSGTGTGFSPSNSVFPCQYNFTIAPNSFHQRVTRTRRANGRRLGTWKHRSFGNRGALDRKTLSLSASKSSQCLTLFPYNYRLSALQSAGYKTQFITGGCQYWLTCVWHTSTPLSTC